MRHAQRRGATRERVAAPASRPAREQTAKFASKNGKRVSAGAERACHHAPSFG
jgi:hypothetical protein